MLCKLEGDKYSCSYLRKGQGRITDTTRLGLQAAHFTGQSTTSLVFYRQLICISYTSTLYCVRTKTVTPSAPAFTSHEALFILPVSGYGIRQGALLWTGFFRFKQLKIHQILQKALSCSGKLSEREEVQVQACVDHVGNLISTDREPSLSYREPSESGRLCYIYLYQYAFIALWARPR